MFGFRKRNDTPDDARRLLDSAEAAPDCPDPFAADDKTASEASASGAQAHYDVMNILILSLVIVFFGAVFLVFTDQQEYSGHRNISVEGLVSGRYFSDIEKKFNSSLPLHDLTHNASQLISSCFGVGNDPDLISLKDNGDDDPYSIDAQNGFVPITSERRRSIGGEEDERRSTSAAEADAMTATTTDDGKHKKISGITMTTTYDPASYTSATSPTTTNTREPGATTTTTFPGSKTPATTTPDPYIPDDSDDDKSTPDDSDDDNEDY